MDQEKILAQAKKLHENAKDGSLKISGKLYEFKFDRYQGYYVVTEDGEFLLNSNTRLLKTAKVWLKEWLQN